MNERTPLSLLVSGARIIDPASGTDAVGHVGVRDGRIDYVGKAKPKDAAVETIHAKGLWLVPGAVDLCARPREPGAVHKATIRSEAAAARAAGITTLCMPPETRPVVDTPSVIDRIQLRVAKAGGVDLRVLGALTQGLEGEALPDMAALAKAGVVGATNALAPVRDLVIARRALEYAQGCGLTVHVVPMEASLAAGGCAHEGPVALRLGLSGIPTAAETVAIAQWLALVEETGARVHFGRLSTRRGVEMVEQAQRSKLPVTADVAAHQLFLTEDFLEGYPASGHLLPPLRSAADQAALRAAVKRGVISAICSDHQPHEADAKTNPLPDTEPGISALETLWPLVLMLVQERVLTPSAAVARLTTGPARILNLETGAMASGMPAHLALIDPKARWHLDASALVSAGHCTPFDGHRFTGRVVGTIHAGRVVFRA